MIFYFNSKKRFIEHNKYSKLALLAIKSNQVFEQPSGTFIHYRALWRRESRTEARILSEMHWFNFIYFYKYFTHETYVNRSQCITYCKQYGGHIVPYGKVNDMRKIFTNGNLLKRISDQIGLFYFQ